MFTVAGSGFGLYGYLPALIAVFGQPVLLQERYRAVVEARPELRPLQAKIEWVRDLDAALARATGLVIATPPFAQGGIAARALRHPGLRQLVLEKPPAPTPQASADLLEALRAATSSYRLGYTFLATEWLSDVRALGFAHAERPLSLRWTFMAHHFARDLATWKRSHAAGGGVLRFYGIHVLALLAHEGYTEVEASELSGAADDEPERWRAAFSGPALPRCEVDVDSRAGAASFVIATAAAGGSSTPICAMTDPFEPRAAEAVPPGDRRVAVLARLLRTFDEPDDDHARFYDRVNALWERIESRTRRAGAR